MQLTPYVRPYLLKNDVGRDLKKDIRDKENSEGCIIFRSRQFQVFLKAKD